MSGYVGADDDGVSAEEADRAAEAAATRAEARAAQMEREIVHLPPTMDIRLDNVGLIEPPIRPKTEEEKTQARASAAALGLTSEQMMLAFLCRAAMGKLSAAVAAQQNITNTSATGDLRPSEDGRGSVLLDMVTNPYDGADVADFAVKNMTMTEANATIRLSTGDDLVLKRLGTGATAAVYSLTGRLNGRKDVALAIKRMPWAATTVFSIHPWHILLDQARLYRLDREVNLSEADMKNGGERYRVFQEHEGVVQMKDPKNIRMLRIFQENGVSSDAHGDNYVTNRVTSADEDARYLMACLYSKPRLHVAHLKADNQSKPFYHINEHPNSQPTIEDVLLRIEGLPRETPKLLALAPLIRDTNQHIPGLSAFALNDYNRASLSAAERILNTKLDTRAIFLNYPVELNANLPANMRAAWRGCEVVRASVHVVNKAAAQSKGRAGWSLTSGCADSVYYCTPPILDTLVAAHLSSQAFHTGLSPHFLRWYGLVAAQDSIYSIGELAAAEIKHWWTADLKEGEKALSGKEMLNILAQVMHCALVMYEVGVAHNDFHPGNLLLMALPAPFGGRTIHPDTDLDYHVPYDEGKSVITLRMKAAPIPGMLVKVGDFDRSFSWQPDLFAAANSRKPAAIVRCPYGQPCETEPMRHPVVNKHHVQPDNAVDADEEDTFMRYDLAHSAEFDFMTMLIRLWEMSPKSKTNTRVGPEAREAMASVMECAYVQLGGANPPNAGESKTDHMQRAFMGNQSYRDRWSRPSREVFSGMSLRSMMCQKTFRYKNKGATAEAVLNPVVAAFALENSSPSVPNNRTRVSYA